MLGWAAVSMAGDDIASSLVPTGDGRGVAACVSATFGDIREVPMKTVKAVWSLIVCITQPIHPYHYVRDKDGAVIKDRDGHNRKVWLPFYRLFGEHQNDSVVGIVYDNRGTNGVAGSHWFANYNNQGWQDKGGKTIGLALLAWGGTETLKSKHHKREESNQPVEAETVVSTSHSQETPAGPAPQPIPAPQPMPPPALPTQTDGEGHPVGGN